MHIAVFRGIACYTCSFFFFFFFIKWSAADWSVVGTGVGEDISPQYVRMRSLTSATMLTVGLFAEKNIKKKIIITRMFISFSWVLYAKRIPRSPFLEWTARGSIITRKKFQKMKWSVVWWIHLPHGLIACIFVLFSLMRLNWYALYVHAQGAGGTISGILLGTRLLKFKIKR